jgi:DNA-binding transcriptional LysR family regulator
MRLAPAIAFRVGREHCAQSGADDSSCCTRCSSSLDSPLPRSSAISSFRERQSDCTTGAAADQQDADLHNRLKAQYPLIQLVVQEGQDAQLETWLEEGSVDLAILYRTSATPKNGDTYLVETSTYLVSAVGDRLTSRPTVRFSALNNLPLVLFCRPSSWRDHLDQISAERKISLTSR